MEPEGRYFLGGGARRGIFLILVDSVKSRVVKHARAAFATGRPRARFSVYLATTRLVALRAYRVVGSHHARPRESHSDLENL